MGKTKRGFLSVKQLNKRKQILEAQKRRWQNTGNTETVDSTGDHGYFPCSNTQCGYTNNVPTGKSRNRIWDANTKLATVVKAAEDNAGVIAAASVAGLLVLVFFVGITIFCFYRNGKLSPGEKKKKRKNNKKIIVSNQANGYPHPYEKRQPHPYQTNGVPKHPRHMPRELGPVPPMVHPYATYHGPPQGFHRAQYAQPRPGTLSGPPPIVIPLAHGGTVTMRPDPRPVIQTSRHKHRDPDVLKETNHRSHSKHRKSQPQEFVIQPSYDGIPVIRPVIYIDDDDNRERHRSKSRSKSHERLYKKKSREPSPVAARLVEIPLDDDAEVRTSEKEEDINANHLKTRARSRSLTPPPRRSPERSRASSVTEAVNALRNSVKDHTRDSDSEESFSSKAPSFKWAQSEIRPPEPAAGDVMFFPAGHEVQSERHTHPQTNPNAIYGYNPQTNPNAIYGYTKVIAQPEADPKPPGQSREADPKPPGQSREEVYGYTTVIKASVRQNEEHTSLRDTAVSQQNHGYEVPTSLKKSMTGTRDEEVRYETEHGRQSTGAYNNIGASMSDRLTALVEDGDKTRFSHYNVGAVNLGEEDEEEEEPVEMRVRRPRTPPVDIPRDSYYSRSSYRPDTPPNDIPLITPRESTEIPPLNLYSSVNTPRDLNFSYRPPSPPTDFPITPKTSFKSPRPATPPFDIDTNRSEQIPTANRSTLSTTLTNRSEPIDPKTGEPGSFQARQRLIEAHLMAQASPQGGVNANKSSAVHFNQKTEEIPRSEPNSPRDNIPPPQQAHVVHITPGVVPPAPPLPPNFLKKK